MHRQAGPILSKVLPAARSHSAPTPRTSPARPEPADTEDGDSERSVSPDDRRLPHPIGRELSTSARPRAHYSSSWTPTAYAISDNSGAAMRSSSDRGCGRSRCAGVGQRSVVELASELHAPAHHRHRNLVGGKLFHERVAPFHGNWANGRYTAARRSTAFSCSSSRIRRRESRDSFDPVCVGPGLVPSSTSASHPFRQGHRMNGEIRSDLLQRHPFP